MELILLGIYSFLVWLIFFKMKWLPWNITSQVIVVTIPIIALTILILFMNIVAPSSSDVRAMNYVIPIVPRVTGQVTEVPIEPNRPIKKGDVLFKIDPVPFERPQGRRSDAGVEQGGARHRPGRPARARRQLRNATAKKARRSTARLDLAKKRVEQFTALAATGAGKRADLEQAESDVANLRERILGRRRHRIAGETEARRAHRGRAKSTRWRRPRRRSPRPKPISPAQNTISMARRTSRPPTGGSPISRSNPACGRPSSPPCPS